MSPFQAKKICLARSKGSRDLSVSLDLEISSSHIRLIESGIEFAGRRIASWTQIESIRNSRNDCFAFEGEEWNKISTYSEESRHVIRLRATSEAPALLISGFTMHRFKDISPRQAAKEMVKAIGPLRGRILDTATGLGYAALAAADRADQVVTIEAEPGCIEMAGLNPWSRPLFSHPRISLTLGDSARLIRQIPDSHFDAVLHDPPSISLAGDLYAGNFYRQVWRILTAGGRFFHYIGDPQSTLGSRTTRGVVKRIREAGFCKIIPRPRAFGILAIK